jgi:integration host factor subunit beta
MTNRELIEEVVRHQSHLRPRDVEALVGAVFTTLSEALARGERIEIRGFGSFIVKKRSAREGLNPKTGEPVAVAAKRVPFFKAGKELKLRVDGKVAPDAAPASASGES